MSRAISKQSTPARRARRAPLRGVAPDYLALVKAFPLRPIPNEDDYDRAAAVLDGLVTRTDLTRGEADYMETLTLIVQAHDHEHHGSEAAGELSPLEMLEFLMEQHSMSTTGLGEVLGSKGVASEVLNGKRGLSKAHIAKLAQRFAVSPGIFLEPLRTTGKTAAASQSVSARRSRRTATADA